MEQPRWKWKVRNDILGTIIEKDLIRIYIYMLAEKVATPVHNVRFFGLGSYRVGGGIKLERSHV